jgi:hypothetical protein
MTIEERVRRVLEHAVATEPPPRRAPLDSVRRRRRRRPVLAGAVAVVLVLAAVVGLAAVRRPDRVVPAAPTLTTLPTAGWAGVDHRAGFSFLRPPGWELRREDNEGLALIPPDARPSPGAAPRFRVRVAPGGYWRNNGYWRGRTPQVGRLPGGQAYLLTVADPPLQGGYAVDWGRVCRATRAPGSCLPTSVHVEFTSTGDARLWDRYRPVIETIVGTLRPLRPTDPTTGDRSRPACTADQWKLVYPNSMAGVPARQRTVVPAGVGFRGGRPCHLRVQVSMALEQGGRPLAVRGNPAPATIELDLPEDALPAGYQGVGEERILQLWTWDQECVPVPGTDLGVDIVFRDERGGRLLALPTLHFEKPGPAACGAPGAASVLAPWP